MVKFFKIPEITEEASRIIKENFSLRQQSILLAFIVGLMTGLLAVAFKESIHYLGSFTLEVATNHDRWYEWLYLPLIAATGGAIAGLIVTYVPEASGSGIPEIRLHLARVGKRIRRRNIIAKFFGGIVAIGSGFSLGREGPTVSIGAASGTFVSSIFKLTGVKEKQLFAAGAGAGLAAAFNTPIAGVIFVVEELSHNFSSKFLAPCIVASITASAITRYLSGNKPSFEVLQIPEVFSWAQIPVYILLGLIAGVLGTVFTRSIIKSLDVFDGIKGIPLWVKVALAGLITGIVGVFIPEAIGDGHAATEKMLTGAAGVLWLLPLWFLAKIFLTAVGYGPGTPGGIFAPSLFCGAALGLFMGKFFNIIMPDLEIVSTNLALVGMGAFFTAVVRTPITAMVIIFEMTNNYQLILPLMLSCILADLVSQKLYPRAIYPALLFRSTGLDLEQEHFTSPLQQVKVGDVMTSNVQKLSKRINIAEAFEAMERSHHNGLPIVSRKGRLLGIITLSDLEDAFLKNIPVTTPVEEIMSKHLITITPDKMLDQALDKMHLNKIGRILVVDPQRRDYLVGIVTRSDILKAEVQGI
jgi:CIC family chloride channel protein